MNTYDSKQVVVIVGGVQISGFAPDTKVIVRRNTDAWTLQMGADGEGTRSKSNDKSGQIEIQLQQGSQSNAYLSNLALADELSNAGVVPTMVKDNLGKSLHVAEQTYVKKITDAEYGREAGTRVWILETDSLQNFVGGN